MRLYIAEKPSLARAIAAAAACRLGLVELPFLVRGSGELEVVEGPGLVGAVLIDAGDELDLHGTGAVEVLVDVVVAARVAVGGLTAVAGAEGDGAGPGVLGTRAAAALLAGGLLDEAPRSQLGGEIRTVRQVLDDDGADRRVGPDDVGQGRLEVRLGPPPDGGGAIRERRAS